MNVNTDPVRYWCLIFGMGLMSVMCGYGLQYKIYPIATMFGIMSLTTAAVLVKELEHTH